MIISDHGHLIARAAEGARLQDIIRDLKKYTSKQVIKAIEEHRDIIGILVFLCSPW